MDTVRGSVRIIATLPQSPATAAPSKREPDKKGDYTMSEILTKARELGQAIVDSEEYKNLKAAEEKQEKSEEAMALLVEYNNVRKRLAEEINASEVSDERMSEIREELEKCYEKVMSNPDISEYYEAQRRFESIVSQMNSILTYFMTGEISGGCSGNCSGCSSCG